MESNPKSKVYWEFAESALKLTAVEGIGGELWQIRQVTIALSESDQHELYLILASKFESLKIK